MLKDNLLNNSLLISAGSFKNIGGWVLDTQFIPTMGAPYLLAHGIGEPVEDAETVVKVPSNGVYNVFVYTFNWVAPWKPQYAPGIFRLSIDGNELPCEFGKTSKTWGWENGGKTEIKNTDVKIVLHDLTGYEGRCGFIFLTKDNDFVPPADLKGLKEFYKEMTGNTTPEDSGHFDMVVCGAGIAGICTALQSARQGLKVALIQDRPVVGGNNSSEVRVWLGGGTNIEPFPGIGNIVGEIEQKKIGHYGEVNVASLYEDDRKMELINKESNITSFMSCSVIEAEVESDCIKSIIAWDYKNDKYIKINGFLFCDATGDATLGAMAGADYEQTTNGHMGMTNFWYIKKVKDGQKAKPFAKCPWAVDLSDCVFPGRKDTKDVYNNQREKSLGCWFWESGMELDPIQTAEFARDMNFRAMYGAWDCVKNVDHDYTDYDLGFSAYIGGKRESRRLFGDVILTKPDVFDKKNFEDGCVPTTWNFDVHYPDRRFYGAFYEGDAFLTKDYREIFDYAYFIPYRCLYSRNINNMYMAGRDVSVSHDALGTARIMRTGGMMGEVIGVAASLCKKYDVLPRAIYTNHLDELLKILKSFPNKETFKPESYI